MSPCEGRAGGSTTYGLAAVSWHRVCSSLRAEAQSTTWASILNPRWGEGSPGARTVS